MSSPQHLQQASQRHLLLVDDDPDLLRLLSMRLIANGYRVTAVGSAEAAQAQLAIELPALVISDIRPAGDSADGARHHPGCG
jgi:two-component system response regulator GlrR